MAGLCGLFKRGWQKNCAPHNYGETARRGPCPGTAATCGGVPLLLAGRPVASRCGGSSATPGRRVEGYVTSKRLCFSPWQEACFATGRLLMRCPGRLGNRRWGQPIWAWPAPRCCWKGLSWAASPDMPLHGCGGLRGAVRNPKIRAAGPHFRRNQAIARPHARRSLSSPLTRLSRFGRSEAQRREGSEAAGGSAEGAAQPAGTAAARRAAWAITSSWWG